MSRARQKIVALLAEHGVTVDPDEIYAQTHRGPQWDLMPWSGYGTVKTGLRVTIGSWDTMANCARRGATVKDHRSGPDCYEVDFEVYAPPSAYPRARGA